MKNPANQQHVEFAKHAEDVAFGAIMEISDQMDLIEEHMDVLCAAYPDRAAHMRKAFEQIQHGYLNAHDVMIFMYQDRVES